MDNSPEFNKQVKAKVTNQLKGDLRRLWESRGYENEAEYMRSLLRDQVIRHRTTEDLLYLQRVECEKAMQLKLHGRIEYEDRKVKDICGCLAAPLPLL